MSKIIVVVDGGNVINVYSNSKEQLECEIIDYDNGKIDEDIDKYNDSLVEELANDENYKSIY